jgi:hypothetical protein
MRRFLSPAALAVVACAVPATALVLAQEPKAAAPRPVAPAFAKPAPKAPPMERAGFEVEVFVKELIRPLRPAARAREAVAVKGVLAAPVDADAQKRQLVQQFTPQFRPYLGAELHLVRTVCELSEEERRQLARGAQRTLEAVVEKYVAAQLGVMRGQRGMPAMPDPRKFIEEGVAELVQANLSIVQSARYRAEVEARNADRKQAAIRSVLAKLDQDLVLSPEQREKIQQSLSSNWSDSWSQLVEMSVLYGDQFFPGLADPHIVPFLNAPQRDVWQRTQKYQGTFWGIVGNMAGDDLWDDVEWDGARDAPKRAVR